MSIQQTVNYIAQVLGRPALIEDRKQRVVAYSPQSNFIDEVRRKTILEHHAGPDVSSWLLGLGVNQARESFHLPQNAELNMLPRLCVPIWKSNLPLGYLWFIEAPDRMDALDVERAHGLGDRLAEEWYRWRMQQNTAASRNSVSVRNLLLGSGETVARAAEDVTEDGLFAAGAAVRALVIRPVMTAGGPHASELRERLDKTVRAATRTCGQINVLSLVRPDHAVLLVPTSDTPGRFPDAEDTAQRLLAAANDILATLPGVDRVIVGIGEGHDRLDRAQESYTNACRATQIAVAFDVPDRIVHWGRLGVYRSVYSIAAHGVQASDVQAGLAALLSEKDGRTLLKTAECYLNLGCRVQDAAAQLNLHRTSLYYRLERIERIVGVDLQDGVQRLGLHLAIMLTRIGTDQFADAAVYSTDVASGAA
ncbi:hypothetical protein GCM10022198_09550 [Klugiella xanthotipulae]|uniref:DNA-binding PucR family transcriptional regulator n=1 Tax=Klugiella xanthotipulae TaxID=244735 RepID=A0A543I6S1_9MICO|nr:PucR family transcriptional regulator [Klugiella xanthotipulae]TQM66267.1 DNA-binding PucR family transcriptional regulator [Klugiella xanthotipulae]